jgi:hypothetical protein
MMFMIAGKLPGRVQRIAKAPLNRSDYPGVAFTEEQWRRLLTVFPDGAADWTRLGVGQTETVSWLNYAKGPGEEPFVQRGQF